VPLVFLGDGRKAQDIPVLLLEDVANQIVLVQPLHNDHNGAVTLVVEPAVEGMVVPLIGGLPLRVGQCLLRL
jgi:hypothetical protein